MACGSHPPRVNNGNSPRRNSQFTTSQFTTSQFTTSQFTTSPIRQFANSSTRMVADVFRRDHENHVLGDIRRVVADALEVAGNQDQIERGFDRPRVADHEQEEIAEY